MRAPILGLSVPILLLAAAFVTAIPTAAAQDDEAIRTISGRVVSDEGKPLAGVSVSAQTYQDDPYRSSVGSNAQTITDEEGRYTLELREGKGWINVYYEKWRRGDGREISITGDADDVDFTLIAPPPKTAIIVGTVVGPNGEPIEGAEVNLQYVCCQIYETPASDGASGKHSGASSDEAMTRPAVYPYPYPYQDDYQYARTDEDGKFRFEAYAGPRQVMAWAKGYAQTTVQFEAEDNDTTEVEVELVKVPARDAIIEGRVVNAETGLPVKNAQINVRSLEWGRYAWAQTDDDGEFRVETLPGWTELSVSYYEYAEPVALEAEVESKLIVPRPTGQQYYPYATLVDLEDGGNDLKVELEPKPKPTIALIGYVVDPGAKKGVEGARVSVWNHETSDWGEAITDKTGSYKILVRPGHYTINAWKEGYLSGGQSFQIGQEPTQRKDVLLPKGETRYAPCYDDSDCGGGYPMLMYAEASKGGYATATPTVGTAPAADSGSGTAAAEPAPAPAMADGDAPQARGVAMEESATSGSDASSRSGTAAFSGSGGGLPEYDPSNAGALPAAQTTEPGAKAPVPAAGVLVAALALIGAALVAARRK